MGSAKERKGNDLAEAHVKNTIRTGNRVDDRTDQHIIADHELVRVSVGFGELGVVVVTARSVG